MAIEKVKRESNLELLRILCVLAIIGDHFVGQSGVMESGNFVLSFYYSSVVSLSRVACSVFIIISAWFSVDKPFKMNRIGHAWLTAIMYLVPLTLYMYTVGRATKSDIFAAFFPVGEARLWFVGYYIVLMLISPLLNLLINNSNRKVAEMLLGVMGIFMVLYSTITANLGFFSNDIWVLIFLYVLTGYWKKYLKEPSAMKSIFVFVFVWVVLTFTRAVANLNGGSDLYIWSLVRNYGELYRARMQTIPNLVLAYSVFFAFKGLKLGHIRIINTLATTSLGVYCWHQVPTWYNYLWENIFLSKYFVSILHGRYRVIYTAVSILSVWIMGVLIELFRSKVSYWLIESRVYYFRFCDKADAFFRFEKTDYRFARQCLLMVVLYFLVLRILSQMSG